MSTIAVTTVTQDDLRAAPAWVAHLLLQWAPPDEFPVWELYVYTEMKNGRPCQHFDIVNPAGSIVATGEMPELLRHVSKANLATIARGSLLVPNEDGLPLPWFFAPTGTDLGLEHFLRFRAEAAWLLGVTEETLDVLSAAFEANSQPPYFTLKPLGADTLAKVEELNPGIRETWAGHLQQAITAVHLL